MTNSLVVASFHVSQENFLGSSKSLIPSVHSHSQSVSVSESVEQCLSWLNSTKVVLYLCLKSTLSQISHLACIENNITPTYQHIFQYSEIL